MTLIIEVYIFFLFAFAILIFIDQLAYRFINNIFFYKQFFRTLLIFVMATSTGIYFIFSNASIDFLCTDQGKSDLDQIVFYFSCLLLLIGSCRLLLRMGHAWFRSNGDLIPLDTTSHVPILFDPKIRWAQAEGVLQPKIVVGSLFLKASSETKKAILAHEQSHLKEHDILWNKTLLIVNDYFWFLPYLKRTLSRYQHNCELVADQLALIDHKVKPRSLGDALLMAVTQIPAASPGMIARFQSSFSQTKDRLLKLTESHSKLEHAGILRRTKKMALIFPFIGFCHFTAAKTKPMTYRCEMPLKLSFSPEPVQMKNYTPRK